MLPCELMNYFDVSSAIRTFVLLSCNLKHAHVPNECFTVLGILC